MPTVRYTTVNGRVIAEKRGGVRKLYRPDHLGSTIAMYDNTQAKTDTWVYWPYGAVRTRTGTTATPFQFVGVLGYFRDSSDRTYVRARVLRTDLGTWMTVDPLWPEDLAFTYGWASPVTFTDHSGTQPRPKASGIPKPLMQCLTKKAQQILLDKLGSKKCSEAIKKECGKSGTDALNDKGTVPKYLFEKDCSPGMQGEGGTCRITLPTNPPPPYPKGSKCEVLAICLAIDLCTGRGTFAGLKNLDLVQACTVIWELGNACSCKKNGYDPQENGAARVAAACGCGGVVGPGGAAIR